MWADPKDLRFFQRAIAGRGVAALGSEVFVVVVGEAKPDGARSSLIFDALAQENEAMTRYIVHSVFMKRAHQLQDMDTSTANVKSLHDFSHEAFPSTSIHLPSTKSYPPNQACNGNPMKSYSQKQAGLHRLLSKRQRGVWKKTHLTTSCNGLKLPHSAKEMSTGI